MRRDNLGFIEVNWSSGHVTATGQCEMICPEVFEVDLIAEVKDEHPDPSLHERVREAADSCPTGAILLHTG